MTDPPSTAFVRRASARLGSITWLHSRPVQAVLLVAVVLVPLLATAVLCVTRAENLAYRTGDHALIELATRDVIDGPVLLGAYSRYGWSHPGPLLQYLYAVPFHLLGQRPEALSLGAVVIAIGSVTGIAWVAVRRGGMPLLLWTMFVLAAYLRVASMGVTSVWNPLVTMLPFALVIMCTWSLACGDWWALPFFAGVGSLVVQGHAGFAAPVGVCIVYAAAFGGLRIVRARDETASWLATRQTLTRAALVTVGVGFLVWVPPLVEQVTHEPGNLGLLLSYVRDLEQSHSITRAMDRTASLVGALPVLATGTIPTLTGRQGGTLHWSSLASLAGLAAAALVAWRRRAYNVMKLAGLVALLLPVSVYAVTRIEGPLRPYLTRWISALAIPLWIAVGAAVLALVESRRWSLPAIVRPVAAVAVVGGVVFLSGAETAHVARVAPRDQPASPGVAGVVAQADELLTSQLATDADDVVIRVRDGDAWKHASALMLQLERRGRSVTMDRSSPFPVEVYLPDWRVTEPGANSVVLEVDRDRRGQTLVSLPGAGRARRAG